MQRTHEYPTREKISGFQALTAIPFILDEFDESGNFASGGFGPLGLFDACTSLAAFVLTPIANRYIQKENRSGTQSDRFRTSGRYTSARICNYILETRKQSHLCKSNLSLRRKTRILKHFHKVACPIPTVQEQRESTLQNNKKEPQHDGAQALWLGDPDWGGPQYGGGEPTRSA